MPFKTEAEKASEELQNESRHTPGTYITNKQFMGISIIGAGKQLAWIPELVDVPHDANAQLFAAAPELLEALRENMELLDWFLEATGDDDTMHDRVKVHVALAQARAAIAKAKGEA